MTFGIKYYIKDDVIHLITTLQQFYKVSIDWSGVHYCGLNIKWNYKQQYVDLSMLKCIPNVLQQYTIPHKPTSTPLPLSATTSSTPYKNAIQQDTSQLFNKQETTQIQQIIGCLLY